MIFGNAILLYIYYNTGLPRNLEKGQVLDKVRENLEKSGEKVEKA